MCRDQRSYSNNSSFMRPLAIDPIGSERSPIDLAEDIGALLGGVARRR